MEQYIPALSPHRKSLKLSIKEGVAAEFVTKILDYYLIPFALFLGAGEAMIGLIVSMPNLLASFSLITAPLLVYKYKSRLRTIVAGFAVQTVVLVPIAFLFLLPFPLNLIVLVFLITIFRVLGTLIGPAWGSLMSDYLQPTERGYYFGGRSRLIGLAGILAATLGGISLYLTQKYTPQWSFMIIFAVAAFFRFFSFLFSRKMTDVELRDTPHQYDIRKAIHIFSTNLKNKGFARFCFYVGGTTFATSLAWPFFSVWLLTEHKVNYLVYTAVLMSSSIAALVAFPLWGKHSDFLGNAKILKRTSIIIAIIPLLWIFARESIVALILVEMLSGFVSAGFNLCATNYLYEASPSHHRLDELVFFNFINGILGFCGAALGGLLLHFAPEILGSKYIFLFFCAVAIRTMVNIRFANTFYEVRPGVKKKRSAEMFFSVVGIKPLFERGE